MEPLEACHAEALFAALRDPDVYRFVPFDAARDAASLARRYARITNGPPAPEERWWNWAVVLREAGDALIGTVELTLLADGRALLAYMFGRAYWGRGYAYEASAAALSHLRSSTSIAVIEASLDTRNTRSRALLERLGFAKIDTIRDADRFKGSSSDEYLYRLQLQPSGAR